MKVALLFVLSSEKHEGCNVDPCGTPGFFQGFSTLNASGSINLKLHAAVF
jgi:hypothetical protein